MGAEVLEVDYTPQLEATLKEAFPTARIERLGDRMQISPTNHTACLKASYKSINCKTCQYENANIEDVFLKLTGRGYEKNDHTAPAQIRVPFSILA